jgi:hypothetical protein
MSFVNPIGRGLRGERVDMGVDYGGTGSLYALGSGSITSVYNSGWPGGTFIGLHLDSGQYVYYAEDIQPHVSVGQRVQAGQLIGTATGGGSGIEVGWAAPPGTGQTMAAATGQSSKGQSQGDPGMYPTGYGVAFNNLIKSLGGTPGTVSGPVQGGIPANLTSQYGSGTTGATLPGCTTFIYYIWLAYNALQNRKQRRRYLSSRKRRHRRRKDEIRQ